MSLAREGVVFAPWHYGDAATAADDLTLTAWDPVSKQPEFKVAAVAVQRVRARDGPAPAPLDTASRAAQIDSMHPRAYLHLLEGAKGTLGDAHRTVGDGHGAAPTSTPRAAASPPTAPGGPTSCARSWRGTSTRWSVSTWTRLPTARETAS